MKKLDIKFGIGLALFLLLVGGVIWWGHEKRIDDLILGADTGAKSPATTDDTGGDTVGTGWVCDGSPCDGGDTEGEPIKTQDDECVQTRAQNVDLIVYDFSFGLSNVSTIDGILFETTLSLTGAGTDDTLSINLSWNANTATTSDKTIGTGGTVATCGNTNTYKSAGGSADTWGRTWAESEFSNANFRANIRCSSSSFTSTPDPHMDHAQITVTYTAAATTDTATQVIIVISRLWEGLKDIHLPTFAELTAPRSFAQTNKRL